MGKARLEAYYLAKKLAKERGGYRKLPRRRLGLRPIVTATHVSRLCRFPLDPPADTHTMCLAVERAQRVRAALKQSRSIQPNRNSQ